MFRKAPRTLFTALCLLLLSLTAAAAAQQLGGEAIEHARLLGDDIGDDAGKVGHPLL